MRNINELIGIIKGINYDGIINDKETARLCSWIERNRNLAYDQDQMRLISLVESVLEDGVIDDNEKKMLIEAAESFVSEMGDNTSIIYELAGIIDGIVCDGIVNDDEVINLMVWLDNNAELLNKSADGRELCSSLNLIIKDGVITETEQNYFLKLLKSKIKDTQFEVKLAYLCRLVREKKNIGVDLIDILDNENAMDEIHKRAEKQLMDGLSSYIGLTSNREIVIVSLSLIAMLEYDGNFYDSVRNTYDYGCYSNQKVEGYIREILSRYANKGVTIGRNKEGKSRQISVALENAIVPQTFLKPFFDFIFDIYKLNFDYDLSDELYEDFQFVYEGLRSKMLSDGNDISLNVTQKTYKLIASTKQLIAREDGLDALIKLSIIIAKLIDKRFWNKEVKIFNPYLKVGYEEWEKQLVKAQREVDERRNNSSELKSRWEPKYRLSNSGVCLVPPSHRIKSQYDYHTVAIVVFNGEEEVYRNERLSIKEIIGGYQINPELIVVNKPIGKLRYKLMAGSEVIYDSRDKLYRNVIVFDNNFNEISNNTDYEGSVFFCLESIVEGIQPQKQFDYYIIGCKLIRLGDAIGIGNEVFNFSSMVKPGVFGDIHKNCYACKKNSDNLIPVYKKVNVVAFEIDNSSSKIEVLINGARQKISDLEYQTTVRGNIVKYAVALNIEKSGLYTVEINQFVDGKRNRILKEQFLCDPSLKYSAVKLDDNDYKLTVYSSVLENGFEQEIGTETFDMDLISFRWNGQKYIYLLPFELGFYKLGNNEWRDVTADIWCDDVSHDTDMLLYDSECDGLLVYSEDGSLIEDNIKVTDKGYYKEISVGFLNSYKTTNKYVLMVFTADSRKKYTVFCYNKCVLDEENTEIIFSDNPKKIFVTPIFHGANKVFFEMFNSNSDKAIMKSRFLVSGQTEVIDDFESFQEYTFKFHEKTKELMLRENTLLGSKARVFYARQDYVGKIFRINEVYFNQTVRGEFLEKTMRFYKTYVRITGLLENDFEAEIFIMTQRGDRLKQTAINPVRLEQCSEIQDDEMEAYIVNKEDECGLLIDFDKRGIMNTLDDRNAPDIFLYSVNVKGE